MFIRKIIYILLLIFPLFASGQSPRVQLAYEYKKNGEFDKAAEIFKDLYEQEGLKYLNDYTECLDQVNDIKMLEKIYKKQIKKNPENLALIVKLGDIYKRANNQEKSKKEFEKALNMLKGNPYQAQELARQFVVKKEYDYAILTYQKAREFNPDYPYSFEIAEVYNAKGDFDKMIDEYISAIDFNPQYMPQVQAMLQSVLGDDVDSPKFQMLRTKLLKNIQQNPDKTSYAEMLVWLFVQQKDFDQALVQAKSIDKRKKEDGSRIMSLASIALANYDYETAKNAYDYLISKGKDSYYYILAKMELVNVLDRQITSGRYKHEDLITLENNYNSTLAELGKSAGTLSLIKGLALLEARYLDKLEQSEKLLTEALELPSLTQSAQAEIKLQLADVMVMEGEMWEPVLLYGQVDKAFKEDPLGHEAKFRNAKLSFYKGEFEWAQGQLDVLKGSTSKLIANDALYLSLLILDNTTDSIYEPLFYFAKADLLIFQHKNELAFKTLDSITTLFPGHSLSDDILYKKGEIELAGQQYAKAVEYFAKVAEDYKTDILGDDATYKVAYINEVFLNDKQKAMDTYQKLLEDFPGSIYGVDARKRFRLLRGDKVN